MGQRTSNKNTRFFERDIAVSREERRWLLIFLDLAAVNGGLLFSLYFRPDYELSWSLAAENPEWFVLMSAMWIFFGSMFQVYDLERAGQLALSIAPVASAGLISVLVYNFIPYLPPALPPSRQPFFITILSPLALLGLVRGFYMLIFSKENFRRRLLIVGAGWAGKTIFQAVEDHGLSLYEPVGFVDDDPQKLGKVISLESEMGAAGDGGRKALPVLGPSKKLPDMIREHKVSTVVLAITHLTRSELLGTLTDSLQQGVEILPMPVLYEQLTGKVPVEHIGDHWSVSMPLDHPGTQTSRRIIKRVFDLFWAGIGIIFLAIVFPFLALAIYVDSPGPIVYKQRRLGRNGTAFYVYKFRSMIPEAEKGTPVWAEEDDPRVTWVGRLLRKSHLDEFPQFINILKGEMSVVGPRPERPEMVETLEQEIPFYHVRLAVKPGMAGWGLIHLGYGSSVEDTLEKLQYDLYYIKHQTVWMDMRILVQTIFDSLSLRGT